MKKNFPFFLAIAALFAMASAPLHAQSSPILRTPLAGEPTPPSNPAGAL